MARSEALFDSFSPEEIRTNRSRKGLDVLRRSGAVRALVKLFESKKTAFPDAVFEENNSRDTVFSMDLRWGFIAVGTRRPVEHFGFNCINVQVEVLTEGIKVNGVMLEQKEGAAEKAIEEADKKPQQGEEQFVTPPASSEFHAEFMAFANS